MQPSAPATPPPSECWAGFLTVRKNRDACIHWLLRLAQRIEVDWSEEDSRLRRLSLLRQCLEDLEAHAHADCRELAALAPRMMHTLDFTERHFLNLMLPIERKWSKGLRDHDFLVSTDDRQLAEPSQKIPLHLVSWHVRPARDACMRGPRT